MRAPMLSGIVPRSRVVVACVCMLIASPALAQDGRLARLDPATGREVAQLLDQARRQRLPVEPLVDKALEGASKGAPGARIVDAVRRLSGDLAESRRLLGPEASEAEVTAGAHALRAKLAPAALRRLKAKRERATLMASLGVYQDLVAFRVSPDTAAAVAVLLHEADVSTGKLAEFQNEVSRDIAVGGSPAMVAAVATERMVGPGLLGASADAFTENRNLEQGGTRRPKRKP